MLFVRSVWDLAPRDYGSARAPILALEDYLAGSLSEALAAEHFRHTYIPWDPPTYEYDDHEHRYVYSSGSPLAETEWQLASRAAVLSLHSPFSLVCAALHAAAAAASHRASGLPPGSSQWRDLWEESFQDHQRQMLHSMDRIRYPTLELSTEQRRSLSPAFAVAWDRILSRGRIGEFTVSRLVEAYLWAERRALCWHDPVQRMLAEQSVGEEWLEGYLVLHRRGETCG